MSRRYRDPIRVWQGPHRGDAIGAVPVRFRWRRRTYVVTEILGHWIEVGSWWAQAGAALRGQTVPAQSSQEHRVWRVEARTAAATGVFDLCEPAPPQRGWLLLAALD